MAHYSEPHLGWVHNWICKGSTWETHNLKHDKWRRLPHFKHGRKLCPWKSPWTWSFGNLHGQLDHYHLCWPWNFRCSYQDHWSQGCIPALVLATAAPAAIYIRKLYNTKNENYCWSHGYQVGLAHTRSSIFEPLITLPPIGWLHIPMIGWSKSAYTWNVLSTCTIALGTIVGACTCYVFSFN
jgi:hypothetical protein